MPVTELRQFKKQLTTQLLHLRQQQQEMRQQLSSVADATGLAEVHDTKDEAMRGQMAETETANAARHREEIVAIEAALERIVVGTYGVCTQCGKDIALPRLRSQPSALRCQPCQTSHERRST